MKNTVTKASKQRSEGVITGKKADKSTGQKTAVSVKNDFVQDCQNYLQFLIGGILRQAGLCSNLILPLSIHA